jgi:hypothetical protein
MGTGAETRETEGGASQSRDVIPELCFSYAHEPIDSNSKAIATLPTWGQFFFQLQIRYLAYQVFNKPRSIATVVYGALQHG